MSRDPEQRKDAPPLAYRDAGVDIDRQDQALDRIRELVQSTKTPGVVSDLGSFGGIFAPDLRSCEAPLLVASCDGVGTKLRVAVDAGVHDTVGRDLVNHCVNDILVQGAEPLFFLDYVATGRLDPAVLAAVVAGVARGCRECGCALLGGEIAEMPGFYADRDYDVAGFVVGLVDRPRLIDGSAIRPGDAVLGLPSAGLHTNGFSLARKIFFEVAGLRLDDRVDDLGTTVGEALLAEHRCYLQPLREPVRRGWIRGLAHITGGGLVDNVPRILPPGTAVRIERKSWAVPPLFAFLRREGNVAQEEMDRTFNMGIGMAVVVAPERCRDVEAHFDSCGQEHRRIGAVVSGGGDVTYV
jgi:phosphoribosylformylglycinamidine cyclo-ligase